MTESFYAHPDAQSGRNVRAKSAQRGNGHALQEEKKKKGGKVFNMHMPHGLRLAPTTTDDARLRKAPTSPLVLLNERPQLTDTCHNNLPCRPEEDERPNLSNDPHSVPPSPSPSPSLSSDASNTRPPDITRTTRNAYASDNEADNDSRWPLVRDRPHTQSSASVSISSATRRMRDWSMQPTSSVDRDEAYWRERRNGTLNCKGSGDRCTSQSFTVRTLPRSGVVLRTLAEAEAALGLRGNSMLLNDPPASASAKLLPFSTSLSGGNLARRLGAFGASERAGKSLSFSLYSFTTSFQLVRTYCNRTCINLRLFFNRQN